MATVSNAAVTIKLRGDTAANWTSKNPVLAAREPGVETDTNKLKIGYDTTAWNSLGYVGAEGGVILRGMYRPLTPVTGNATELT